jgi:membrane-bound ClpP family serine protease
MITEILTALVAGYILFEVIEHVVFPLVWLLIRRRKSSPCGKEGMIGKEVQVRSWDGGEGCVFVEGELWSAVSSDQLNPGDKAFIQEVEGLVLKIVASK